VPDISLADVAVSALTSALVALGVEWLTKPRLEARKQRVLQHEGVLRAEDLFAARESGQRTRRGPRPDCPSRR